MHKRSLRKLVKTPFFSFVESISELGICVASRSNEIKILSCFKWLSLVLFPFSKKGSYILVPRQVLWLKAVFICPIFPYS